MEKTCFSVEINASRQKVWEVLWNDSTYRQWTSVFDSGSHAETDWQEGSKVKFLSAGGDGMFSIIDKNVPPEFMSFRHMGIFKNGEEQPLDEETRKWAGAFENYLLRDNNGFTLLEVELDISPEHRKYFEDTFPKALDKIKVISES